jgi:4-amino-4-deoxychorismate lyase
MNEARKVLFGNSTSIDIAGQLTDIENFDSEGILKCRILYSDIIHSIEFQPYTPRVIRALTLIEDNTIDYTYKYADRSMFDRLPPHAPDTDLLIVKNGFITDTTFSNIVFYDGTQWVTPSTYLLNGTQRQRLLREGRIVSREIRVGDLSCFISAKPINAMLDFDATPEIEIASITIRK